MFKDKAFNMSVLFSTAWHLFWISIIAIVITPSVQPSNMYQEIGFLGPILEKTAFDIMLEGVAPQRETLYARTALFLDEIYLKPEGPKRIVLKEFIPDNVLGKFSFNIREYISSKKEQPSYYEDSVKMLYEKRSENAVLIIEGPAGERGVMFKPHEEPSVPKGLYGVSEKYIVKLKFFITQSGIVYDTEPVISSGYPDVDMQAVNFLKKWRFLPSNVVDEDKTNWGMLEIKVTAK